MAPPPRVTTPESLTVAPAEPTTVARVLRMVVTMAETKVHHQYSLRLARPEKSAYFLKKRFTAAPIGGAP